MPHLREGRVISARDCRSAGAKTDKTCRICGKVGHLARDYPVEEARKKGSKGTKRGRGRPAVEEDLDREMDLYHGKPAKKVASRPLRTWSGDGRIQQGGGDRRGRRRRRSLPTDLTPPTARRPKD